MTATILLLGLLAAPAGADRPVPCDRAGEPVPHAVPADPPDCAPVSAPAKDA